MPRQFQMISVGGMTLEARTRMLGLFPSEAPPSHADSAAADNKESSLREFLFNDLTLRTDTFLIDSNARPCLPINQFIRLGSAPDRPTSYRPGMPGNSRSVRDALFTSNRASLNYIRRHRNLRSFGVKVRGSALELHLRERCSAAILLKAGLSDVAAFAGANT